MSGLTDLAECVDRYGSADAKRAFAALLHTDPRAQVPASIYPELGPETYEGLGLEQQMEQLRQHVGRIEHNLIAIKDRLRNVG